MNLAENSQRGRVRTFDLVYPKHVRYQLRYTLNHVMSEE